MNTTLVSGFIGKNSGKTRGIGYREEQSPTLDSSAPLIAGTLPASGAGLSRPAGQGNELDFVITGGIARSLPTKTRLGDGQDEDFIIAKPLLSHSAGRRDNGGDENLILFDWQKEGGENPTMVANRVSAVSGHGEGVRRLMPVECERLQGFPDGWTDGQADSARYRQLGNAVAVPCAEWIGRRIAAVA